MQNKKRCIWLKIFVRISIILNIFNYATAYAFRENPIIITTEYVQSIEDIARKNFHLNNYYSSLNNYIQDLKKWNKQIKNFSKISKKSELVVTYPYNHYLNFQSSDLKIQDGNSPDNWPDLNLSFFFGKSQATINEQSSTSINIAAINQNSPLTFGLFISEEYFKKKYFISGSIYYSLVSDIQNSITKEMMAIPAEIGANIYLNFKSYIPFYVGLDLEDLNTINSEELQNGSSFKLRKHKLSYLTLGASKIITLFSKKILLKSSISAVILSSSKQENVSITRYTGYKYIAFSSLFISRKFSINSFFKLHQLNGIVRTQILRFGLGINFKVF